MLKLGRRCRVGGWGAPHFLVGHLPADASGPALPRLFLSLLHEESQASVIVRILQVGKQAQEAERAAQGHAAFRLVCRLFQAPGGRPHLYFDRAG